mmetsp:Transcript_4092/g.5865  ORF Transcript_4092/g.5865 Transcript_4092/m.5865 type:complete len:123 (-) Transcript_4092:670-1038(-)
MELQLPKECAQLTQIGKSNNSHIYKQLDKNNQALGQALKLIVHSSSGNHSKECQHLHNEHNLLKNINHCNIVSVKERLHESVLLKGNEFCAIELELADSDLFDKMSELYPNVLTPVQVRGIF